MPKKSREQKILTQLRRLQDVQNPLESVTAGSDKVTVKLKDLPTPVVNAKPVTNDYKYITADLRKTIIFASVAVIFEVALAVTVFKTNF